MSRDHQWDEMTNRQRRAAVRNWKQGVGMGRGGYVPPWVKRLPLKYKTLWCRLLGHPVEALETFTWLVEGQRVPGHMCLRCFARVEVASEVVDAHPRLSNPL